MIIRPWAAAVLAIAATATAWAGHYDIVFTPGPSALVVGQSNGPWHNPYTITNGGSTATMGGGCVSLNGPGPSGGEPTGGSVTCSDQMQATATWNNGGNANDIPPPFVIIKNVVRASWSGSSGSCDDGFHDPQVGGVSSGTHYTYKDNPGASFPLALTETANGSRSSPVASAGVGWTVTVYAIKPVLTGVSDPISNSIMIGQNLGGYVDTGGLVHDPLDTTSWYVSGCSSFKSYVVNVDSGGYPYSSTYTGFTTQSGTLSTHLARPGSYTVYCTMYFKCVDKSWNIPVYGSAITPNATWGAYMTLAEIPPSPNDTEVTLQHTDTSGVTPGIFFVGSATTPSPFNSSSSGWWNQVQFIMSPYRYRDGLVPYDTRFTSPMAVNGVSGLDTSFPYETPMNVYCNLTHAYDFVANGSANSTSDAPSQTMFNEPSQVHIVKAFDSFATYMMYFPPGGGSQYVPLKDLSWYWKAYVHKPALEPWYWDANESAWGFLDDFPDHPIWNYRHDTRFWVFQ